MTRSTRKMCVCARSVRCTVYTLGRVQGSCHCLDAKSRKKTTTNQQLWLLSSPHPHPFTSPTTRNFATLALSHPKLLHQAHFHLLHTSTTTTTTFHFSPTRLPPVLSPSSPVRKAEERDWRRVWQYRSWRGFRFPISLLTFQWGKFGNGALEIGCMSTGSVRVVPFWW